MQVAKYEIAVKALWAKTGIVEQSKGAGFLFLSSIAAAKVKVILHLLKFHRG